MTILGEARAMFDALAVAVGLETAMRGVLRIKITATDQSSWVATGWLITDSLVVVNSFSVQFESPIPNREPKEFICHPPQIPPFDSPIAADPIYHVKDDDDAGCGLLRLRKPLLNHSLDLDLDRPTIDDQLVVLHYPADLGGGQVTSTQVSFGRVRKLDGPWIYHNADTYGGSSGGAVLAGRSMHVLGMNQWGAGKYSLNGALGLTRILEALEDSPAWAEIAKRHGLADVSAAHRALRTDHRPQMRELPRDVGDETLVGAALHWNFDPQHLTPSLRAAVRPLVADASAPRWSLVGAERQRLIDNAGSLPALRRHRESFDIDFDISVGQQTIDRILEGPPYAVNQLDENALPYWLQAVRWFKNIIPDLPAATEIQQALELRRLRSRLATVAGSRLVGRTGEMDRLREWYGAQDAGPLVVTGVGGIGKSALLAQFALAIPLTTPVLWLDFDRADIAPDDALSVIGAMAEQVALQYDWTDLPELGSKSISAYIDGFGRALARVLPVTTRPLVVLDGFEVAQHVVRHDELWQVLDALLVHVPAARVVVSGRAPVGPLTLGGHSAQRLHLDGIGADAARAWLTESGVTDPDIVQRVVQASHGIPLILKLAVRLHRAGGDDELRDELPKKLVEGFLYRRILDRVLDPSLRLLASDVLVVRWLTVDMLAALFQDSLPRGVEPTAAFTRLSRELALVEHVSNAQIRNPRTDAAAEDVGPLRLRQEVRSATLQLLETEHRERVREIDRRAAEWYASSAASNRIAAAELVYHRLRLGDVEGAAAVWRDEHAPLMLDAVDDMPESEPDAGAWLADRLASAESTDPISRWETDAMARIHSALNRGLPRAVEKVLSEREERTAASPLIVYDAWTRLRRDDASGARGLLADATRPSGTIARDRSVLQALLARAEGDSAAADRLLASLEDEAAWADQIDAESTVLCVRSARIRLSVDIAHELDLTELLRMSNVAERLRDEVQSYLPPSDVTVPALAGHLRQTTQLRSRDWASVDNNVMKIETHGNYLSAMSLDEDPQGLSASIDNIRQSQVHGQLPAALRIDSAVGDAWTPQELELDPSNNASVLSDDETDETILRVREIGIALATLGRQRWRLTIGGVSSRLGGYRTFVAQACALAVRASLRKNDALHLSIVATLAALHEAPLSAAPDHSFRSLDEIIIDALSSTSQVAVSTSSADVALAHRVVSAHQPASSPDAPHGDRSVGEWLDAQRWDKGEADWRALASKGIGAPGESRVESEAARSHVPLIALLLFILGPDPLELLCRRVLGIPDDLPV